MLLKKLFHKLYLKYKSFIKNQQEFRKYFYIFYTLYITKLILFYNEK